jgi:hypothetical protein
MQLLRGDSCAGRSRNANSLGSFSGRRVASSSRRPRWRGCQCHRPRPRGPPRGLDAAAPICGFALGLAFTFRVLFGKFNFATNRRAFAPPLAGSHPRSGSLRDGLPFIASPATRRLLFCSTSHNGPPSLVGLAV